MPDAEPHSTTVSREATAERRPDFDALRLLAMAGVVSIHVLAAALVAVPRGVPWRQVYLFVDRFANAVSVPAFLFLTGALVWSARDFRHSRTWWSRRLRVVFVPYLVWSLVYFPVAVLGVQGGLNGRSVGELAAAFLKGLVTGSTFYHLYYPPILLGVYLLTPLAGRALGRSPSFLIAATVSVQALLVLAFRVLAPPPAPALMLANFLTLTPFAAAGAWYAALEPALARRTPLVLAAGAGGLVLLLAQSAGVLMPPRDPFDGYFLRFATMVAVAAVLVAATGLLAGARTPLSRIGATLAAGAGLAYGVYLAHPLVLFTIRSVVRREGADALWASPLFVGGVFAGVLGVTLLLVYALKRRPATAWTV